MLNNIPVVLFAYRRPDILEQTLNCFRADGVPFLHIFSDGPGNERIALEVAAVRDLIRSIDWCERVIVESPINLGLGVSVKRGVSIALRRYGAAIFFEDDLISVPGTYQYLSAALRHYERDPKVMSVTAWTHPNITPSDVGETPYFDGKGECWAWGTWAKAWEGMEDSALAIMQDCEARGINIEKYGTDMPRMAAEAAGRNLWAVGWWYHHMRRDGLCMRTPRSLVEHICWDKDRSTTSTPEMMRWSNPPLRPCPPIPEVWPEPVEHPQCAPLWRKAIDG